MHHSMKLYLRLGASGACNEAVAAACQPDADCVAEQACLSPCQKKK